MTNAINLKIYLRSFSEALTNREKRGDDVIQNIQKQ